MAGRGGDRLHCLHQLRGRRRRQHLRLHHDERLLLGPRLHERGRHGARRQLQRLQHHRRSLCRLLLLLQRLQLFSKAIAFVRARVHHLCVQPKLLLSRTVHLAHRHALLLLLLLLLQGRQRRRLRGRSSGLSNL